MTPGIDLDAYFERIGYTGPRSVSADTLAAIHLQHPRTIPFENLNPFLRWPVRLDAPSLHQKLVRDGRGGYCYEHNLLLSHVLQQLGFRIRGLAARVLWNVPEGTVRPRSHVTLQEADDLRWVTVSDRGRSRITRGSQVTDSRHLHRTSSRSVDVQGVLLTGGLVRVQPEEPTS